MRHAQSRASPFGTLVRKCLSNTDVGGCVAPSEFGPFVYSGTGWAEVGPQRNGVGLRFECTPVPNYSDPLLYARCTGKIIYGLSEFDGEKEVGGSVESRGTEKGLGEKPGARVSFERWNRVAICNTVVLKKYNLRNVSTWEPQSQFKYNLFCTLFF